MMLYKLAKAIECSPDSDTDNIDIVTGVIQGDILASFLSIIVLDYAQGTVINGEKILLYTKIWQEANDSAENIIDAAYMDDLAFLANTPAQTEYLMYSLE